MVKKIKSNNKGELITAAHQMAKGLHKIGLIDKNEMAVFNAICIKPVPKYPPKKIKALRERLNISQSALATIINASPSAVRKWEVGEKNPSGPSLKLLNILDTKGLSPFIN